jgi:hypothetical protein
MIPRNITTPAMNSSALQYSGSAQGLLFIYHSILSELVLDELRFMLYYS